MRLLPGIGPFEMANEAHDWFQAELRSRRERARRLLPPEQRGSFDSLMEHVASGRHSLEMLSQSLSPAQARVVNALRSKDCSALLSRSAANRYDVVGTGTTSSASASTVRALISHGVLRWMRLKDEELAGLTNRGIGLIAHLNART